MRASTTHKRTKIGKRETSNRSAYAFLAPYLVLFATFIIVPMVIAMALSFTNFNTIQFPSFVGFLNYVNLLTRDEIFMQYVLPKTVLYALIVGPGGYILSFILAWALAQLSKTPRTILALIFYSPSMTSGVAMTVLWKIIFSGDQTGYLNSWLMRLGIINEPIIWLLDVRYLLPIVIIVALWSSMGVGFLAMLAGILNADESLYEAAALDGVKNRFQEMWYITIPTMKPQMLFGAVMAIVGTFQNGLIGVQLSGANPTPNYAAQLIVNHIEDYGFIRYEMGYAAAVSVVLLGIVWTFSKISKKLFQEKD
ncbi:multiple sugar transport system permease protein [Anaerosporobacter mobilis DSM 15930]|uniref:Multiple sugar transport system permease protein n=1 Tax=Anaerosporobacter mobilis DSM 15930 TaxID=1120996 RepID=A0A1M7MA69_9FIRM|nr:sugar ABC transporter permease [Anaerosporobacter mobilis]SHM87607.1 multiple sugar transport system permease protein [Anaerosporobacter mobilis DSM 15930]